MGWYKVGMEAKVALERSEKISQLLKAKSVPRFWLRVDEEAEVIFVDDLGFWCEVHTVKIGDKFFDLTCCAEVAPCPICLKEGKSPSGVVYFTVIDLRQFVDKQGNVIKNRKVLLGAKRTLAKQLFDLKNQYGSLVGRRVKLKRYTAKDANTGIVVHVFDKIYNVAKLGELGRPFEYEKVLAPPTQEELAMIGYNVKVVSDSPLADIDSVIEEDIDDSDEDLEAELEEDLGNGLDQAITSVGAEQESVSEDVEEDESEVEDDLGQEMDLEDDEDLDQLKSLISKKILKVK